MSQPSSSSSGPSTPSHTIVRSGLPTPSGIARRSSLAANSSPIDSPDTAYKKQSLAEAISRNDPAKYRSATSTSSNGDSAEADRGSPILTAGKLPRPGMIGRRSTAGLRPRSETPTGLPVPQGSQLSPPSLPPHSRAASAASSVDGIGGSPSRSRSPLVPAGRPNLSASVSIPRGLATPKRLSDIHGRTPPAAAAAAGSGSAASTATPGLPSHAAATIASRAREQPSKLARRGKDLEIGDIVIMEGQDLTGVLRFLGPVQGMNGSYAGLELIGDCIGKGKNNGSVKGVQYFACADGDGVFCPVHKVVAVSDSPPKDAVARPASAMSNRSSSRQSDVYERPPSTTPGRRRASTVSRPPSTTPSRASSRASVRPPSATPGSRPASAMSLSRPSSRLTARKSLGAIAASRDDDDQEPQRRAKTSAEYAAAAEKRITEGSRAHKLLGMTAKDLQQRRIAGSAGGKVSSRLGGSPVKGALAGAPSSPLKSSLIGTRTPRSSLVGGALGGPATPGLPKARQSLGGIPTPRAAKGRVSMFARPPGSNGAAATMPPPRSPTKDSSLRPASALSMRSSSRLSNVHSAAADDDDGDPNGEAAPSGRNSSLDRARDLLEAMDLTPRRPAAAAATGSRPGRHQQSASFSGYGTAVPDEPAFQQNESVAEAVVPLSLYEEQEAELERLRTQAEELEKKNAELTKLQGARKARMSEIRSNEAVLEEERAKMRAEAREKEREMDEERQIERQDDLRRRKEIEDRERELKERLERLQDEHLKAKGEHESQTRDLQAKLQESATLVDEMKRSLEEQAVKEEGDAKAALEVQLKVKDAEIESMQSAVRRLEAELQRERKELGEQIDELKDAGRETISLYEQRIEEVEHENHELLDNMKLLEQRAQEAIGAAEARYEALAGRNGSTAQPSAATEIDNENLREQVAHLQDRLGNYEDQIAEATMALEKEKEYLQKKKERAVEVETSLKNEIKRLKAEVERLVAAEREAKERFEEVHAALDESKAAHETERAELEVLRADVQNIESLNGGSVRGSTTARDLNEARKKWEAEKSKYEAEIKALTDKLGSSSGAAREAGERSLDVPLSSPGPVARDDSRRISSASSISVTSNDTTNRRSSRTSINGGMASSEASSANQVSGLNYLVRQLTEENAEIKNKHKMLESEVKDKLRAAEQKARTLELTVEALQGGKAAGGGGNDAEELAAKLAECEQRLRENDDEIAKLRLRVKDVERSREREVSSLNKEVAELEALVEARIFREDELEGEIDRLKRKVGQERSAAPVVTEPRPEADGRGPAEPSAVEAAPSVEAPVRRRTTSQIEQDSPTANRRASRRLSGAAAATSAAPSASTLEGKAGPLGGVEDDEDDDDDEIEDFCGLCSKRGHSVVDCKQLDQPPAMSAMSAGAGIGASASAAGQLDGEACDDCGEHGHRFEECPYANEIF
ncbi:uncharacterized protein PFL1_03049 [Pseudozyma flocculosa PF-1]|uniref:Related to Restin (Intermediate filament-associated protein) n=2 Tax=Pseudozyma flocculosa TaxID=84751 RepID=A0A5C3F1K4_9BASI|nr:uncharacterized protein PFL1_03049 [Pseudozyma flocculosa PF-1]EPQ29294.1 hypothetical protein PFL1_03049 [Pseudozyma flocculosa PF-1]SPO37806.1 related to Restin (intermediate filament-associated protein) [Pseudozyma flocculosa]